MERPDRSYTEDFKRLSAELVMLSGRSIPSVAKDLGLQDSLLRCWVDKFPHAPTSATEKPMSADQASEFTRLLQERDRLRMERDILERLVAIAEEIWT
ncbi:transposase [Bradyrhizobium japonicum]|uniref:transposase n=1 Tax=Bradyrhizobium japonicum TaxID=375 RepID=UPI003B676050